MIDEFKKTQTKRDISFWTKCSEVDDGILMLRFTKGMPIKKALKDLIKDEMKISQIIL